jgi:predicted transcriptional regulator with HTH domain
MLRRSHRALNIIILGLTSSFFTSLLSRKRKIVFVSLKNYPFTFFLSKHPDVVNSESSIRGIFSGASFRELDALYYLIHSNRINRPLKKIMLFILTLWVRKKVLLSGSIFIVHQDYYERGSVLTTLSQLFPLSVFGVQHGLMTPQYLRASRIYPGVRTRVEFVVNEAYKGVMTEKKGQGSLVIPIGKFLFQGELISKDMKQKRVTFISSGDLSKAEFTSVFKKMQRIRDFGAYELTVRPHPSETFDSRILDRTYLDPRPRARLFHLSVESEVFVGFYSTLLFEASILGYRTVWIKPNSVSTDEQFSILGLSNSITVNIESFSADMIHNFFTKSFCVAPTNGSEDASKFLLRLRSCLGSPPEAILDVFAEEI